MIKEMVRLLLEIRSLIIVHLGRNPVSGGRPPRDSRENNSVRIIIGILFHIIDIDRVVVMELNIIIMNMHRVSVM